MKTSIMLKRRRVLACLGGLPLSLSLPVPLSLALTACDRGRPVFSGIDITGAAYGPDFHLPGPDGRQITLADFRGRHVLLFFGFTQCPDVCPTALSRAVELRRLLGADGARVQVLFVTIDPERDTPALLQEYMRAFDPGFIGLAGSAEQTARIARDFKIYYRKVASGSSYTMDHSAVSYVFDAGGKIRLAFKHDLTAAQCADDLRRLMHG